MYSIQDCFLSEVYHHVVLPVSAFCGKCKQLILGIFGQLQMLALQKFKSLKDYVWNSFDRFSLTSHLIRSQDIETMPIGPGEGLPIDIVAQHIFPHLPIKTMQNMLLTNKAYLKVLVKPEILDSMLSTSAIDPLQLVSAVGPYVERVTQLNLISHHKLDIWESAKLVQKCSNLKSLYFVIPGSFTEFRGIEAVARNCRKLEQLNLNIGNYLSAAARIFARNCPLLKTLALKGNGIDDSSIDEFAERCPNLESLDLTHCRTITDNAIRRLTQSHPNLKNLGLINCAAIKESTMQIVVQGFRKLTVLGLNDCSGIGDDAIRALAQGCPELTSLYLAGCTGFSDSAIQTLVKNCPHLTYLNLFNCGKLTDNAIQTLKQSNPNLDILT